MKEPLSKASQCDGKVIFLSKKLASIAAALLTKKGGGKRPLVPYKCKYCLKYHFGHSKKSGEMKQPAKQQRQKQKLDPKDYGITRGFKIVKQTDPFKD